jgi:hypothetical protein
MEETIRVCQIEDESEANLICSVLDEKEIPYVLKTMRDSVYDGLYVAQGPWGFIEAPNRYFAQIAEIVTDLRETRAGGARPKTTERRGVTLGRVVVPILIGILVVLLVLAAMGWARHGWSRIR